MFIVVAIIIKFIITVSHIRAAFLPRAYLYICKTVPVIVCLNIFVSKQLTEENSCFYIEIFSIVDFGNRIW
jgi:hypothetical protein